MRSADGLRGRNRQQPFGGGIDIGDARLSVEHDHALAHFFHHHVARDGGQVHQAESEDAPHQRDHGDGKSERGGIQIGDRAETGEIDDVPDPRRGHGHEQRHALARDMVPTCVGLIAR